MFCIHCGLGIPDDAPRCLACDAPQSPEHLCVRCGLGLAQDARACTACGAVQTKQTWEYCEIRVESEVLDLLGLYLEGPRERFRFWADAAGPHGVYTVAWSDWGECTIPGDYNRGLYEGFVAGLCSQGWQPYSWAGHTWWGQRFRRAVSGANI